MYRERVPYKYVKRKNHPLSTPSGRIPLHRVVLWDKIGPGPHPCHWCRAEVNWLPGNGPRSGALVTDHLDGNTTNNDPANLVPSCQPCNGTRRWEGHLAGRPVITQSNGKRDLAVERTCLTCGNTFLIAAKHIGRGNQGRYCSMQCVYRRSR